LHPISGDSLPRLAARGAGTALRRPNLSWGLKLLYLAWFLAMVGVPRRKAFWLAEKMVHPERRGVLSALIERLRQGL
jgi:hypothetical protein